MVSVASGVLATSGASPIVPFATFSTFGLAAASALCAAFPAPTGGAPARAPIPAIHIPGTAAWYRVRERHMHMEQGISGMKGRRI